MSLAPTDTATATATEVEAWKAKYHEHALIASIETDQPNLFISLLNSGEPVDSSDYQRNRGASFPILPIHVAAKLKNQFYLETLVQRGADPDDSCQYQVEEFENTFRAAVTAGKWENVELIINAGGVHGDVDTDYYWEARHQIIIPEDTGDDLHESAIEFIYTLFDKPWAELTNVVLPDTELERRRVYICRSDSFGRFYDLEERAQELSNLEWIITYPGIEEWRRSHLVDRLVRGGADLAAYREPSYTVMWNKRANIHAAAPRTGRQYYDSFITSLGLSYHTVHTPIHLCVFTKNVDLIKYFVNDAHLNVDMPEFTTRVATPLMLAIKYGYIDVCKALVELGAQICFVAPIMRLTALHFAATTHDVALLLWVIDKLKETLSTEEVSDFFAQKSLLGHTALHVACMPHYSGEDGFLERQQRSIHYVLPLFDYDGKEQDEPASPAFLQLLISVGAGKWTDQDHQGNTPAHYLAATLDLASNSSNTSGLHEVLESAKVETKGIVNEFGENVESLGSLG